MYTGAMLAGLRSRSTAFKLCDLKHANLSLSVLVVKVSIYNSDFFLEWQGLNDDK